MGKMNPHQRHIRKLDEAFGAVFSAPHCMNAKPGLGIEKRARLDRRAVLERGPPGLEYDAGSRAGTLFQKGGGGKDILVEIDEKSIRAGTPGAMQIVVHRHGLSVMLEALLVVPTDPRGPAQLPPIFNIPLDDNDACIPRRVVRFEEAPVDVIERSVVVEAKLLDAESSVIANEIRQTPIILLEQGHQAAAAGRQILRLARQPPAAPRLPGSKCDRACVRHV